MKGTVRLAALLSAMLLPVTVPAAGTNMQEGLWEISTTMEMPGMPMKMPATKVRHCYTKEDLKESSKTIPSEDKSCKVSDLKQTGSKTTWKIVCKGEHAGTGEGEIVFKGDSYTGTMKMQSEGMTMTTQYSAKRVGACP